MKDKRNTQQVLAQRYKDMVGKTYRHFKGGLYTVVDVAVHSESADVLVIYRSVSDPSLVWARPISMFLSDVDKYKYPLARQDRRFVEVDRMTDEEKQIEEMAEVIERARLKARGVNGSMNQGFGMWYAKALWEMGYRRDESKCPLQCQNCKFSRMATDAERMGIGLELLVCEIRRNSDGNVYFVTPDHCCGHGEKEAGVSDA